MIPDRVADRPAPFGTIATALLALAAGFGAAYALREHGPTQTQQLANAAHAVPSVPALGAPRALAQAELSAPKVAPAGAAAVAPQLAVVDRGVRALARAAAAEPSDAQRFRYGVVAYLRCDGLAQGDGPYPCPRDRKLERRTWQALRALEHCEALADARGTSEVRIELTPGATSVDIVGGDLDPKAVRQCAGGLRALRTALRPSRMIVAFRFELD